MMMMMMILMIMHVEEPALSSGFAGFTLFLSHVHRSVQPLNVSAVAEDENPGYSDPTPGWPASTAGASNSRGPHPGHTMI